MNVAVLYWFARRQELLTFDDSLRSAMTKLLIAGVLLAIALSGGQYTFAALFDGLPHRAVVLLASLSILGAVIYGAALFVLFGKRRLAGYFRSAAPSAGAPPPAAPPADEAS